MIILALPPQNLPPNILSLFLVNQNGLSMKARLKTM
jgi:hypothetical protein